MCISSGEETFYSTADGGTTSETCNRICSAGVGNEANAEINNVSEEATAIDSDELLVRDWSDVLSLSEGLSVHLVLGR